MLKEFPSYRALVIATATRTIRLRMHSGEEPKGNAPPAASVAGWAGNLWFLRCYWQHVMRSSEPVKQHELTRC